MDAQLEIDFHNGPPRLEREFWEFHYANPEVYATLVRLARQWKERGHRKLGIAALYERCRWELGLGEEGATPKLNNNHRSFYSRLIMERESDLDGLFETRTQHQHD